jgi:hypothetical protein
MKHPTTHDDRQRRKLNLRLQQQVPHLSKATQEPMDSIDRNPKPEIGESVTQELKCHSHNFHQPPTGIPIEPSILRP